MAWGKKSQKEMFQLQNRHLGEHGSANEQSVDEPTRYECDLCRTPGFGPRRRCGLCSMTYHPFCGDCPASVPCFLHPGQHGMSYLIPSDNGSAQCIICYTQIAGSFYLCHQTGWAVHPICFLLRQRAATDTGVQKAVTHFSHPGHSLREVYMWAAYKCNACGTMGFGLRYRCEGCNFDLHHYCATCPEEQPCLLHPTGHKMARATITSGCTPCVACGDAITRNDRVVGLHYCCERSRANAHPLCVRLLQLTTVASIFADSTTVASTSCQTRDVAGGRRRRKRDILFSLLRFVFLNSLGIPDVGNIVDFISSF